MDPVVGASIAVNQPKGTKNESNSQPTGIYKDIFTGCKSTQRYKERKQFTTEGPKKRCRGGTMRCPFCNFPIAMASLLSLI